MHVNEGKRIECRRGAKRKRKEWCEGVREYATRGKMGKGERGES